MNVDLIVLTHNEVTPPNKNTEKTEGCNALNPHQCGDDLNTKHQNASFTLGRGTGSENPPLHPYIQVYRCTRAHGVDLPGGPIGGLKHPLVYNSGVVCRIAGVVRPVPYTPFKMLV